MFKTYDGRNVVFINFVKKDRDFVTHGDNNKGKILGEGIVGNPSTITIDCVLFVKGLKNNLLNISKLCDKGYSITFDPLSCIIEHKCDKEKMFKDSRIDNVYMLNLDDASNIGTKCLVTQSEDSWLWHRRLGHVHFDFINKIAYKNLVIGLPKIKFSKEKLCDACQMGKQTRVTFKFKNCVSTSKSLELLHLDLFGPSRTRSLGGNYYGFVIVDDFTRFTWTLFLSQNKETFKVFVIFAKLIQNQLDLKIVTLRSDHGGEFVNHQFEKFCNESGIVHNFSCLRTQQQNGIVERKNQQFLV